MYEGLITLSMEQLEDVFFIECLFHNMVINSTVLIEAASSERLPYQCRAMSATINNNIFQPFDIN